MFIRLFYKMIRICLLIVYYLLLINNFLLGIIIDLIIDYFDSSMLFFVIRYSCFVR